MIASEWSRILESPARLWKACDDTPGTGLSVVPAAAAAGRTLYAWGGGDQ